MSNQPWFVYIVRCADDTLYTGITTDVAERIIKHNQGQGAKYTRGRGPVILIYQEKQVDKSAASQREAEIKKLTRQEKLLLVKYPKKVLISFFIICKLKIMKDHGEITQKIQKNI